MDPLLVLVLTEFARSSIDNARLAQVNPRMFVQMAVRASGRDLTGVNLGILDHETIATTPWEGKWLQPIQQP